MSIIIRFIEDIVKRLFVLVILTLIFTACNDDSSSDSDTSFRIQPGTLSKFDSPVPGTGTSCTIDGSLRGGYAIIYNGTIGVTSYVGIACSNNPQLPENPNPETYYLKVYFPATSIPTGAGLTLNNVTINDNGTTTTSNTLTSINITGPTTTANGKYTYYIITGNITGTATSDTIVAVKAN